jgi:hypothetical protein
MHDDRITNREKRASPLSSSSSVVVTAVVSFEFELLTTRLLTTRDAADAFVASEGAMLLDMEDDDIGVGDIGPWARECERRRRQRPPRGGGQLEGGRGRGRIDDNQRRGKEEDDSGVVSEL